MDHQTNISLNIPEIVNIITILNLVIMFIILFFRKNNTKPNKILAFVLLLPALNFINNYFILSGRLYLFPSIVFISQTGAFLVAPLICEYTAIFMGKRSRFHKILHLFTVIILIIYSIFWIQFIFQDNGAKLSFTENILDFVFPRYFVYIKGVFFVLMNIYFVDIAVSVWLYSNRQKDIVAGYEKIKLRYLQMFIIIIWSLNLLILISYRVFPNFYIDFIGVPVITDIFYLFLLITSFNHSAVFTQPQFNEFKRSLSETENISISKSGNKELDEEEVTALQNKLEYLMEDKKIYTDPEINIIKFSEQLGRTVHQTSYFINTHLNTNFFNLINSKRIELAKEEMKKKGEKAEIEVIGYQVGFNSKSAFYRAFNRYVQQSPSQFISEAQISKM